MNALTDERRGAPDRIPRARLHSIIARLPPETDWRAAGLAGMAGHLGKDPDIQWLAQSLAMQAELDRLGALLRDDKVRFLVLKGGALGRWLYPAPDWRMMSDIDLLIDQDRLDAVDQLLRKAGYRQSNFSAEKHLLCERQYLRQVGGLTLPIDLHWQLSSTPLLRGRLSVATLWQERMEVGDLAVLSAEHALLHAAMHRAPLDATERDRGIWLLDIHLLWEMMDEPARQNVRREATRIGITGLVQDAINAAADMFAGDRVEWPLTDAERDLAAAIFDPPARVRRLLRDVFALDNWTIRAGYLRESLLPNRRYMKEYFGGSGFRHYWHRLFRNTGAPPRK